MNPIKRTKNFVSAERVFSACETLINILIFEDKDYGDFQFDLNEIYSEYYHNSKAKMFKEKSYTLLESIKTNSELPQGIRAMSIERLVEVAEEYATREAQ